MAPVGVVYLWAGGHLSCHLVSRCPLRTPKNDLHVEPTTLSKPGSSDLDYGGTLYLFDQYTLSTTDT